MSSEDCRRFVDSGGRSSSSVKGESFVSACRLNESFNSHISFQSERELVKETQACAHEIAANNKRGDDIGPNERFGTLHDLTLGAF